MAIEVDRDAIKSVPFILRATELVFSIIVFAVIADYTGYSKTDYAVFTGVTGFIIALCFIITYLLGGRKSQMHNIIQLIVDCIWWVFWLCCAAVLSSAISDFGDCSYTIGGVDFDVGYGCGDAKSRVQASCAFAWLCWFLWTAQVFFDTKDLSSSGGFAMPASGTPVDAATDPTKPAGVPPPTAVVV